MGLALGVYSGRIVQIGERFVKVLTINGGRGFTVGECTKEGELFKETICEVTEQKPFSLMENVIISAGIGTSCMARLVIDAPRTVPITRIEKEK